MDDKNKKIDEEMKEASAIMQKLNDAKKKVDINNDKYSSNKRLQALDPLAVGIFGGIGTLVTAAIFSSVPVLLIGLGICTALGTGLCLIMLSAIAG